MAFWFPTLAPPNDGAKGAHFRSVVAVGACDSRESLLHAVNALQRRSEMRVGLINSYSLPTMQTLIAWHNLSAVSVSAACTNCVVLLHTVAVLHVRSLVRVGALIWYSVLALHVVMDEHVGGTVG